MIAADCDTQSTASRDYAENRLCLGIVDTYATGAYNPTVQTRPYVSAAWVDPERSHRGVRASGTPRCHRSGVAIGVHAPPPADLTSLSIGIQAAFPRAIARGPVGNRSSTVVAACEWESKRSERRGSPRHRFHSPVALLAGWG